MPVDETAHGPLAVGLDPDQQSWCIRGRFVVWKRLGPEELDDPPAACWSIDRVQACGQRLGRGVAAQRQCLRPLQQGLDGPPQSGPKLNLSRDGTLEGFARQ